MNPLIPKQVQFTTATWWDSTRRPNDYYYHYHYSKTGTTLLGEFNLNMKEGRV
jgi:hypothetical protein